MTVEMKPDDELLAAGLSQREIDTIRRGFEGRPSPRDPWLGRNPMLDDRDDPLCSETLRLEADTIVRALERNPMLDDLPFVREDALQNAGSRKPMPTIVCRSTVWSSFGDDGLGWPMQ